MLPVWNTFYTKDMVMGVPQCEVSCGLQDFCFCEWRFSQWRQAYGRSPVWALLCLSRWSVNSHVILEFFFTCEAFCTLRASERLFYSVDSSVFHKLPFTSKCLFTVRNIKRFAGLCSSHFWYRCLFQFH